MASRTIEMTEPLYQYLLDIGGPLTAVERRLREETASLPMAQMQIGVEQGRFMALLIKLIRARKTLEVGVFTGYSSLAVAQALPEDGKIVACDVSEEWTSIARRYWQEAGVAHKIDLRLGPGVETLDRLLADGQAGTFDFAFIDADKPNYPNYYERSLRLVRPGGLIAIDNTLWSGKVADPAADDEGTVAIRAFNKMISQDRRAYSCLTPIGDGLTLAVTR